METVKKLSVEQSRLLLELANNAKIYLEMSRESEKYFEIAEIYERFFALLQQYREALSLNINALENNITAVKNSLFYDPYIMGGAAEGIGGVGAGLCVGAKAIKEKDKIEQEYRGTKSYARQTTHNVISSQDNLTFVINRLERLLDSIPAVKKYRIENVFEPEYQKGKKLLSSNLLKRGSIKESGEIFESLGTYKDSKTLILMARERSKKSRELIIFLSSLIIPVFGFICEIPYLMCGIFEGFGMVSLTMLAFFVFMELYLRVFIKK